MFILLAILGAGAILLIWRLLRDSPNPSTVIERAESNVLIAPKIEVTLTTSSSLAESHYPEMGPLTRLADGAFLLNPKSCFHLTLEGISQTDAARFKGLLDEMFKDGPYDAERKLLPLLTQTNARVREIESYIKEFGPLYDRSIETLKQATPEWASSSEKDKADMLAEFAERSLSGLSILPDCECRILFECQPEDATIDDALISRYGFENVQTYLRFAQRLDKLHVIPADHAQRAHFEDLVKVCLARRGQDLPLELILEGLTLKQMNELAAGTGAPAFTRKAKAMEFLKPLPDIQNRLGSAIAFRELFQLSPLPPEFAGTDLSKVTTAWAFAGEVASLLARTYWSAGWETLNGQRYNDNGYDFIKGWRISDADRCCRHCEARAKKTYKKRTETGVPLHIGCNCRVDNF